jgi:hypothetical protein
VRNVGKDTLKTWYCTVALALIVRRQSVVWLRRMKAKDFFLSWDKMVIDCLAGSMTLGDTMRDRQLCMVAYLFELGHGLMISPKFNLSCMPRFEAAGLITFQNDN